MLLHHSSIAPGSLNFHPIPHFTAAQEETHSTMQDYFTIAMEEKYFAVEGRDFAIRLEANCLVAILEERY